MIRLLNITHRYGSSKVLQNFDLEVEPHKITCFLGSSGSGKTTLLRLIAGLEIPEEGSILKDGQIMTENQKILIPPYQRRIGFVFQDLALWPHFTVYKNISFGLKAHHVKQADGKVKELLHFFALKDLQNKYPHQLSGGQQQLVAIARALALQPHILLMDEPLSNLDVKLKSKVLGYIRKIQKEFDLSILYVTHDHKEAFAIADQIIVLNQGNIEDMGSVEEIKKSKNEYVNYFLEY